MQMCEIADLLQQPFALCFFLAVKLLILSLSFPWNNILLGKKKDVFSLFPGLTLHSPHWYSKDESLREPNNWNLQGMNCSFSTKYETHHAELWVQQDTLSRYTKMKIKGHWLKGEGKKIMKVIFPQLIQNIPNYFNCFYNRYHAKRPN